jgi:hypothetical protein
VEVLLGTVAGQAVCLEDLLDFLEGLAVNDRFVASFAFDALVGHEAGVVVVAQDAVDAVSAQGFFWALLGGPRAETERDLFIDHVYPVKRGKEMITVWLDWTKTCNCEPDAPEPNRCEPHRWMSACDEFIRLIDNDWYRVADYYRASDIDIHGLDIQKLWHDESADPHPDNAQ